MKDKELVVEEQNDVLTPDVFKKGLERQRKNRELLKEYISEQLVEGTDYGKIHIFKDCPNHKTPHLQKDCPSFHFSKNCMFKPGAEKFCDLLNLLPTFEPDTETIAMLPDEIKKQGIIALKCILYSKINGKKISEGRGACSLPEKSNNVNISTKIAEKRAKVDAVLGLGLSDTFTQDLEDMEESNNNIIEHIDETKDKKEIPIPKSDTPIALTVIGALNVKANNTIPILEGILFDIKIRSIKKKDGKEASITDYWIGDEKRNMKVSCWGEPYDDAEIDDTIKATSVVVSEFKEKLQYMAKMVAKI